MTHRSHIEDTVTAAATAQGITTEEAALRMLEAIYRGTGHTHRPAVISVAAGSVAEGKYGA